MRSTHARDIGLALLELVIVLVLIGILLAASAGLGLHVIRAAFYLPNETRVSQASSDIFDAVTEGSWTSLPVVAGANPLRGLRYSRGLVGAWIDQVRFRNVDGQTYSICRLDLVAPERRYLFRSLDLNCPVGSTNTEVIPYYASESTLSGTLVVQGRNPPSDVPDQGAIAFRYLKVASDGTETVLIPNGTGGFSNGVLTDANQIEVGLVIQTGSGNFTQSDGRIELTSAMAVRFP